MSTDSTHVQVKPILVVKLKYNLEKFQAEIIETDLKNKVGNEYHVLILSSNYHQEGPYKLEVLNTKGVIDQQGLIQMIKESASEADAVCFYRE